MIARHFGKDGSHDFTQSEWEQIPHAIEHPFAITQLKNKEKGFRIYTALKTEKGEYVVVGVDVKNAGRDMEVNAIATMFGRRSNANLSENEEVIYKSKEITPEQEALLSRPNSDQYPAERELSTDKVTESSPSPQENGPKNSTQAAVENKESKPVRFEAGRRLTKEEKKEVLNTLRDAFKENGVPYHIEESDFGKERRVYEPTSEDWVKSDITGRPLRYYITLPDGRVAHPTELFPNISAREVTGHVNRMALLEKEASELISKQLNGFPSEYIPTAISILEKMQSLPHDVRDMGYGPYFLVSYDYIFNGKHYGNSPLFVSLFAHSVVKESSDAIEATVKVVNNSYYMVDALLSALKNKYNSTQSAVESASAEVETSPTEAQKKAGNYKMGHVKVGAFDVTIENPKGSERSGTDANGKKWSVKMNNTYGYIRGTEGVDGDHIDVFLAEDMDKWDGKYVFVVDQYNPDGTFDEHKVMLGFNSMEEARSAYLSNYEKGWENGRRIDVARIKTDGFKKWVDSSHRKTKPFAHYVIAGAADVAEGKPKNESDRTIPPSTSGKVRMQKTQDYSEFAEKYGVNADDVRAYAEGMALGNVVMANQAFTEIRRTKRIEHRGMKLSEFAKAFNPIKEELYEKFGNVDELNQEYVRRAEEERNMMEAARKKAEEEERKRQAHLDELSLLDDAAIDERYMEALQRGDEATAREMLDEAARRKGYGDTASDYQGVGAWVAPANPGYENDAERRADVEDNAPDVNIEDIALGYSLVDEKYWKEPRKYMQTDATAIESVNAIREAIAAVRRGEKNVKVKVYRAVPTSVKEGKLRNGDWVTPSKDYAKMHGEHRLEGKYRIIEDEVSVNDLWWDGNDSREWGFDNGKGYKYKNVKNNRKSDDLVTRDDKGNVIPPSKRFNQRKADERYQKAGTPLTPNSAEVALRDAIADLMKKSGLDVIESKEGQRVLDEANGMVRQMSFGEAYDYEAYPLGRVEPNLLEKEVNVVKADADHGFANYKEAKAWAKENVAKVYDNEESGGKGDVRISNAAIDKFMSQSAIDKSDSKYVHMAVLKVLPDVLKSSIDVETHPDFLKGEDGKRRVENGMNKDVLVHRCYGAVSIDGKPYRVKMTLKEDPRDVSSPHVTHSYEATKIELLAGTWENQEGPSPNTNNSISAAKLLENVGLSYNSGEKVLDASKKRSYGIRKHRVYHGSGVRFFRTSNGEAYGFTVGGKIYIDPRIATAETPIHEYAHLWATAMREGNPTEWKNIVGLMKGTSVWAEVQKLYPELKNDDDIADEVLATFSGRRGAERLRAEQQKIMQGDGSVFEKAAAVGALARVKQALSKFWKGVADFLGIHYTSAEEVADRVMKDLLEGVDPRKFGVSSNDDIRLSTSEKLSQRYGSRWIEEQTNEDGRHTTQVKNTINSYKKFGDFVKRDSNGKNVSILDASSGLGLGTEWMRENGMNVDDVEPYPSENRIAPTYTSYNDIHKKYDYIISNAVLNVIPDDWRANVLHDMTDKLKKGGKLVINVRSAESIRKQGKEGITRITQDDASEILVLRPNGSIKAYQKGFTKDELKKWCETELGSDYSVEIANEKNAGGSYDTAVVVTKNSESDNILYRQGEDTPHVSTSSESKSQAAQKATENLNLGGRVVVHESAEGLEGKEATAKGWYDTQTGQIHVVLSNNADAADVTQTILHEAVAHHGLRELFGHNVMDAFLDSVLAAASQEVKNAINELRRGNGWNFRTATEEYLAGLAERTDFERMTAEERGLFATIRRLFNRALEFLGLKNHELSDRELAYILWCIYQDLQSNHLLCKKS